MIRPEQIPDEVVEAAARKFAFYAGYTWGSKGLDHDAIRGEAAMVILSALNAWPGSEYVYRQPHRRAVSYSSPAIILPLPQEASDD